MKKILPLFIMLIAISCSRKDENLPNQQAQYNQSSVEIFLKVLQSEYKLRSAELKKDGYLDDAKNFAEKSKLAKQMDATHYNENTFSLSANRQDEVQIARLFFEKLKSNKIIFDLFPESLARMQSYYDCMIVEFRDEGIKNNRTKCIENFDNMQKAFQRTGFSKNIKYIVNEKSRETFVIYFELGSVKIEEEFFNTIYKIANKTKQMKNYNVRVTGLADKTGSRSTNEKISAERAENVMKALIKAGVNKDKIYTEHLADDFSLVNTKSAERFNRRVVIDVIG